MPGATNTWTIHEPARCFSRSSKFSLLEDASTQSRTRHFEISHGSAIRHLALECKTVGQGQAQGRGSPVEDAIPESVRDDADADDAKQQAVTIAIYSGPRSDGGQTHAFGAPRCVENVNRC